MLFKVRKVRGKNEYKVYNVLTSEVIHRFETKEEAHQHAIDCQKKEQKILKKGIPKLKVRFKVIDKDEIKQTSPLS
jgi:hypothetical protein